MAVPYCHYTVFSCKCPLLMLSHLPYITQPEGIEKEVTQSSLICTKGKAISSNSVPTDLGGRRKGRKLHSVPQDQLILLVNL